MTWNRKGSGLLRLTTALPLALCLGSLPAAFADQVVYFVNGKAIMVKSVEKGDKFTVLEMDGGGRMGVPTEQIVRIEEYEVSAAGAPVAAIAPAPAPVEQPVASTAPSGNPGAVIPGTGVPPAIGLPRPLPTALGPGMGGIPQLGAQGLAGLRPLAVGNDGGGAATPAYPRQATGMGPGMGGRGPAGAMPGPGLGGPARAGGRPGMGGRGRGRGRPVLYGYQPPPDAATAPAQTQQPAAAPPPPPPASQDANAPADAGDDAATQNEPTVEEAPPSDGAAPGSEEN